MRTETSPLQGDSPGNRRAVTLFRYDTARPGPRVYLQAGLHADEMPGVLVLQHLLTLLDKAEAAGQIAGDILVVPVANPVGLSQWAFQRPLGRVDATTLHNFNRGFPVLADLVGNLDPQLSQSESDNRDVIRAAFRGALAEKRAQARTDMTELQTVLLQWSCDADVVLDLHCDHRAVMHLYASNARPDITSLLCRSIGAELALLQDLSGGNAFDEAHTMPWRALRDTYGDRFPIPFPTFSATLEYRGQFDVDDRTAAQDARNLMTFLAAIGAVTEWPETPNHPDAPHLPLGGASEIFAPLGGVVTWTVQPGARVKAGETLAHVSDPITRVRVPITAPHDGMMFRTELWPSCLRGQSLAHVAGDSVLRDGDLLSD